MEQLKMLWVDNGDPAAAGFPDSLSFSNYRGEEDIADWLEICRNGLIKDAAGTEAFDRSILKRYLKDKSKHSVFNLLSIFCLYHRI